MLFEGGERNLTILSLRCSDISPLSGARSQVKSYMLSMHEKKQYKYVIMRRGCFKPSKNLPNLSPLKTAVQIKSILLQTKVLERSTGSAW